MIPLPRCSALQLAVLAARAMKWEEASEGHIRETGEYCVMPAVDEQIGDCVYREDAWVCTINGAWNPAEDPGDALRLVAWAAAQGKEGYVFWFGSPTPGDDRPRASGSRSALVEASPRDSQEAWVAALSRCLTEASLSSLGVQGWEESEEVGRG